MCGCSERVSDQLASLVILFARGYDGLPAVGEDLNNILVDKDSELDILPASKIIYGEGCLRIANRNRGSFRSDNYRETFVQIVSKKIEAKSLSRCFAPINRDIDFKRISIQLALPSHPLGSIVISCRTTSSNLRDSSS